MSIQIPCPQCGRELKLPDRTLLGRKGKCPKCAHTFILEEPPAVTLELARPESTAAGPVISDVRPASPFSSLGQSPTDRTSEQPHITQDFTDLNRVAKPQGTAARLKELQKKSVQRRNIGIAVVALILVGGGIVAMVSSKPGNTISNNQPATGDAATGEGSSTSDDEFAPNGVNPSETRYAKLGPPTKGKSIELRYMPFGTQVAINLRPAELWKEASLGEEIRYCMPPVAKLVESTLNDLFKRKPEEVEELLICLLPGTRGTLPDVAAIAHMVDEQKRSQLIDQFGQRADIDGETVYMSGERAYIIADQKTLIVGPKSQAQEMVKAIAKPHPVEEIDPLLSMTDRSHHVTVIFTPLTLSLQETWFPENFRPFIKGVVEWLGEDTKTVACSFHLTDELFYCDIVLRKDKGLSPKKYEREVRDKLTNLAGNMVSMISQMNPKEQGKRMVIGRLPAMIEVFSMATIVHRGADHLQLVTPLPDRAAPNMVLGTLLAWDESTRTDFSKAKPVPTDSSKLPATVADRLKMKIDVDFRNMPLNEAFAFIGGEIKTPIDIDGDGLKLGGFTKNIKQTFVMEGARAQDVVLKIFEDSKGIQADPARNLALIIDDSKKTILITTSAVAANKGQKPYVFAK